MRVVFLGTNGWYDSDTGNTICTLIETENETIILDAGNGIYKADRYIEKSKPVYLFLSHFHMDHITGLHILAKFNFTEGLAILGPKGTKKVFKDIIAPPYSVPIKDLDFKTQVFEFYKDKKELPFHLRTMPLRHSSFVLGYRFELNNKVITHCLDTGYCENAVKLGHKSDILITECALKSGQTNEEWPHLNPELAARIAKEAEAKKLVLTHFDASLYQNMKKRREAEKIAKKIFTDTIAAYDGMEIEL